MRDLEKALHPKVAARLNDSQQDSGLTIVSHKKETGFTPESVKPHEAHLKEHLAKPDPTGVLTGGDDVYDAPEDRIDVDHPNFVGGVQQKAIVDTGQHKFLLKPYFATTLPQDMPLSGWSEMTNQSLYHAAGLGHLHQQTHVVDTEGGPMVAIRMEPGVHQSGDVSYEGSTYGPGGQGMGPERIKANGQIGVMDFLTHNVDRHGANMMVRGARDQYGTFIADPNATPLAIDHGRSFTYEMPSYGYQAKSVDSPYKTVQKIGGGSSAPDLSWWRESSFKVRAAFEARLKLIKHKGLRDHLRANFMAKAKRLDWLADPKRDHSNNDAWELKAPNMQLHSLPKAPRRWQDGAVSSWRLPEEEKPVGRPFGAGSKDSLWRG